MRALQLIFSKGRYFAPAFVFATLNILIGTWAIYIPRIKSHLGIDEGELGIAIFCMAIGTLLFISIAPYVMGRIGVGRATAFGVIVFIFTLIIPFTTNSYSWLCVGLFISGAFSGFTDVAMNTLVTEIEKKDKLHIMSVNHGFFSLGGLLSGGIGGYFLSESIAPIEHLLVVMGIVLLINLILMKHYVGIMAKNEEQGGFSLKKLRPLIALGTISFLVMASEGAIVDWSALYLEKISKAPLSWLGLGFTAFSGTMAFGRFFGDAISLRLGSKAIILLGSAVAVIGFSTVLMESAIWVIIGFGLVGLGLSVIIPELFRLGGKTEGIPSGQGISFISGIGFFGFLLGPVLLGFLAEYSSLKLSFTALLVFTVACFLLGLQLKRR